MPPDAKFGSKQPVSVLVLVHTANLHVLLLERTDFPGHWQSVTGSRDQDEDLPATARRELLEETGIATAPGIDFDTVSGNRFVRLSFAGKPAEVAEALERLEAWLPR